jgi:hypothetical protein
MRTCERCPFSSMHMAHVIDQPFSIGMHYVIASQKIAIYYFNVVYIKLIYINFSDVHNFLFGMSIYNPQSEANKKFQYKNTNQKLNALKTNCNGEIVFFLRILINS